PHVPSVGFTAGSSARRRPRTDGQPAWARHRLRAETATNRGPCGESRNAHVDIAPMSDVPTIGSRLDFPVDRPKDPARPGARHRIAIRLNIEPVSTVRIGSGSSSRTNLGVTWPAAPTNPPHRLIPRYRTRSPGGPSTAW